MLLSGRRDGADGICDRAWYIGMMHGIESNRIEEALQTSVP